MKIVNPIELIICEQCGAVVFAPLKKLHGTIHSVFGSFKEMPSEELLEQQVDYEEKPNEPDHDIRDLD